MYPGTPFKGFWAWWTLFGSGMARSTLGQTWSTLIKLGQTSGNVSRTTFWGFSGIVGPSRVRNDLVNPSQTWSIFGKRVPDLLLRVIGCGEPSSEQAGLVRAILFCVSTPEKISWAKMGLWQLPLLCLAFLGTRNVGQRINESIFACLDFLGFRAWLRLPRHSSRFACQSFWGPNGHSRAWRRSYGMRKVGSWFKMASGCVFGNYRVTITRCSWWTRARSHYKLCRTPFRLSFRPFLSLFALWTPLRPFCSFTHILLSGTPIDAPFSPTRSTSKHLPIPTIYFSFKRSKCADLVILFFMSFCLFLMIQDSDRRSVFAYTSYR